MKNTKISAWDYLWYALYSFAGLGLEIVLISIIEPIFFGKISEYNTIQSIIHWILTILCWAIMMIVLVKSSEKKLDFLVWNHEKITTSLMYGIIYIVLNRNTKYSYLAMVIAFII